MLQNQADKDLLIHRSIKRSSHNHSVGRDVRTASRNYSQINDGVRNTRSASFFATSFVKVAMALTLITTLRSSTPVLLAQTVSVTGGSIQGVVTDSTAALVPGANVTIVSKDTASKQTTKTDRAGFYSVGPLNPGSYVLQIDADGFKTLKVETVVRVGTAMPGNYSLVAGKAEQVVEVSAGAVQVNTDQSGVSGIITSEQIDTLPINGRNFLDLAQLQPGTQLQAGESFDPTKAGYSALALNGLSGRTTRILLDGQDITDENVGTTIFNVSQGAVGEFQINRANQDASGDLTSTGQVLVTTRSGSNNVHGTLFYNFQNNNVGFATFNNVNAPFERNQFGGSIGGPLLRDKLFYFFNSERIKQDQAATVSLGPDFAGIQALYPSTNTPFRQTYSTGRLDWNGPFGGHYFIRANYDVNANPTGSNYSLYSNRDNTPGVAAGADFQNGSFTHSVRASYEKFHNFIADFTAGNSNIYNPIPGLSLVFGANGLFTGPNAVAPQQTFQSDKQFRYDGSWVRGRHNIRYGGEFNRLLEGGLTSFFGLAPRANLAQNTLTPGGNRSNPTDYAFRSFFVGNGQGSFSEKPGFGLPGGGFDDYRFGIYVMDSWRVLSNLTLNAGIRYSRDTTRANQDLLPIPCSLTDTAALGGFSPCSGSSPLLDQFGAGLGKQVNQPNMNFGPQVGFVYNVLGKQKTVVRGGFGVFYESNVWNNVLRDRVTRLQKGLFNQYQLVNCTSASPHVTFPGGRNVTASPDGTPITTLCSQPVSRSGSQLIALQQQLQSAYAAVGASTNPNFVGETLTINGAAFAPNYVTPYSMQVNFGVQQELATGLILSVDYLHNSTQKIQQTADLNHVGAARFLQTTAARNAIADTLGDGGYASIDAAIAAGATIEDFMAHGLDSSNNYVTSGYSPYYVGLTPDHGAAFAGANPNVGQGIFSSPSGRYGYDALQVNLKEQQKKPIPGVSSANFELSYSFSRAVTSAKAGSDALFTNGSWNNDDPSRYIGPSNLDQTHQFSFGGSAQVVHGPTLALIGHFRSPIATNLLLDSTAENNIFQTDIDGDGQVGDLLPGTNPGAFMRTVDGKNLKETLTRYNQTQVGQITPAGKALVNAGLFTANQLVRLNAVQQSVYIPSGAVFQNPWFRTLDANIGYPIHLKWISERARLTPAVSMYNVGNFSNWIGTTGQLLNSTNAGAGGANSYSYVNGENPYLGLKNQNRIGRQSGTFDQGDLRSTEFQLHLQF